MSAGTFCQLNISRNTTKWTYLNVGQAPLTNRTAHIRHLCGITTVLSCHRCLVNTGVEKMNNI